MTEQVTKKVRFSFELSLKTGKDYAALPGTAAWVRAILAQPATSLQVGKTKTGKLAVWLNYAQGDGEVSECLALRDRNWENLLVIDYWPLGADADPHEDYLTVNGVHLTRGGESVFRALGKKARTLLRLAIRRGDKGAGPVKLALVPKP